MSVMNTIWALISPSMRHDLTPKSGSCNELRPTAEADQARASL